jgi:hypothetical protein
MDMSWVSISKDRMDHAKWKHVLVDKGWVYGVKDQVSWDETEHY